MLFLQIAGAKVLKNLQIQTNNTSFFTVKHIF